MSVSIREEKTKTGHTYMMEWNNINNELIRMSSARHCMSDTIQSLILYLVLKLVLLL